MLLTVVEDEPTRLVIMARLEEAFKVVTVSNGGSLHTTLTNFYTTVRETILKQDLATDVESLTSAEQFQVRYDRYITGLKLADLVSCYCTHFTWLVFEPTQPSNFLLSCSCKTQSEALPCARRDTNTI